MLKTEQFLNSTIIVIPIIVGAILSGAFYLAEGSSIPLTIFQLTLLMSFILFAFKKLIEQDLVIEGYGLEKWYLLFLMLIFLSIIYTPEREQALFYSIRFSVLLIMTYMIYNVIETERELKYICYAIIATSAIVALINLFETYLNPEIIALNYVNQGKNIIRQSGLETDPNVFASNFFIPIMLGVSFFVKEKRTYLKLLIFSIVGILLTAVLLSYSRSAWISVFAGIMFILIKKRKFDFLIYCFAAFLIVFSISDTVQNLALTLFDRLGAIFAGTSDDSSNIRILLAKASVLMLFDSYLMGVGFQGFSSAFQEYYTVQETIGIYEPHNEFYTVYAELGIIGLVIFCTIILKIFRAGRDNLNGKFELIEMESISLGFFGCLISYLIFYQFYGGMLHNSILLIFIGLLFSMGKLSNKNKLEENLAT